METENQTNGCLRLRGVVMKARDTIAKGFLFEMMKIF